MLVQVPGHYPESEIPNGHLPEFFSPESFYPNAEIPNSLTRIPVSPANDRTLKICTRMILALAYVPVANSKQCSMVPPRYEPSLWNTYDAAIVKTHKTNNSPPRLLFPDQRAVERASKLRNSDCGIEPWLENQNTAEAEVVTTYSSSTVFKE